MSENAVRFAPETLAKLDGIVDTTFSGRRLAGFDSPLPATERDPFSRSFNAAINDTGLPGDVADTIVAVDGSGVHRATNVRVCRAAPGALDVIGDPRTDCTISNNKLDEDDIDLDNALNFSIAQRESERILRYIVDLSAPGTYTRVGGRFTDTLYVRGQPQPRTRNWVLVQCPIQDAHRLAQRRQPPQTARPAPHDRFGAGTGCGGSRPASDRRAAGRGSAMARPQRSNAGGDRRHPRKTADSSSRRRSAPTTRARRSCISRHRAS